MNQVSIWFGQLLKFLYSIFGNYAFAIIVFTIITKLILLPLTFSQMRSMNAMKVIQPKVDEINKKYKKNPQVQAEKLQELYRQYNINPVAGCLPTLIQFPIIIAMYRVVQNPVNYVFGAEHLYKAADTGFLWVKSLSNPDVLKFAMGGFRIPFLTDASGMLTLPGLLPIMSAAFTYLQMQMSMAKSSNSSGANATAESMNKSMSMMMPIMMLIFGLQFPAGLMLYWVVGTIVQIIQQYLIGKFEYHFNFSNKDDKKTVAQKPKAKVKKNNN